MDEGIKIPIDLDPSGSFAVLSELQNEAVNTGESFKKAVEPVKELARELDDMGRSAIRSGAGLDGIENALRRPGENMKNLATNTDRASAALKNLPNTSGQATQAMINLSRVAQDAPYGFIGIANNLNPLLESFQRLKASAGSTGGALKALTSELTGAGGLGLALGIASSLMVVFGGSLFGTTSKIEDQKEAVQQIETSYDRLQKTVDSVSKNLAEEGNTFNLLLPFLKDYTITTKERARVLDELKEKYPSYLDNLKAEANYYDDISTAIKGNIENLAVQTELKSLMSGMNEDFQKAIKLQIDLNQLRRNQQGGESGFFAMSEADFKAEETRIQDQLRNITKSLKAGRDSLEIVAGSGKSLLETLFPDLNKPKKGSDKEINDIIERAKRISEAFKNSIDLKLGTTVVDTKMEEFRKSLTFLDKFDKGQFKFKFSVPVDLTPPPAEEVKKSVFDFGSMFQQELKSYFKNNNVTDFTLITAAQIDKASQSFGEDYASGFIKAVYSNLKKGQSLSKAIENATDLTNTTIAINKQFQSIASSAVSSLAEGLGTALGGGDLKNAFSAFASIIADGFINIGKQMVAAAPVITALKAAIKNLNPAILLPAGIALIGIGSALRASLNNSVKFAQGGMVFGRTLGEFGEGIGTTRQNPEVVAPLDNLKSMIGDIITGRSFGRGGGIDIGSGGSSLSPIGPVELFFDGNDLRGSLVLVEKKQGRLF